MLKKFVVFELPTRYDRDTLLANMEAAPVPVSVGIHVEVGYAGALDILAPVSEETTRVGGLFAGSIVRKERKVDSADLKALLDHRINEARKAGDGVSSAKLRAQLIEDMLPTAPIHTKVTRFVCVDNRVLVEVSSQSQIDAVTADLFKVLGPIAHAGPGSFHKDILEAENIALAWLTDTARNKWETQEFMLEEPLVFTLESESEPKTVSMQGSMPFGGRMFDMAIQCDSKLVSAKATVVLGDGESMVVARLDARTFALSGVKPKLKEPALTKLEAWENSVHAMLEAWEILKGNLQAYSRTPRRG